MNSTQKYSEIDKSSLSQIELETRALIRSASSLNLIKENWDTEKSKLEEALGKNRRLWTVFAAEMNSETCLQPMSIRINILNLANFIFKRTVDILLNPTPEKLTSLIDINMNIARGLSEGRNNSAAAEAPMQAVSNSDVPPQQQAEGKKEVVSQQEEKDEYSDIFGE
ncbi:MAG: flagellar biosynthesis regulator FlaF [Alphaproteobacteria bacterium]